MPELDFDGFADRMKEVGQLVGDEPTVERLESLYRALADRGFDDAAAFIAWSHYHSGGRPLRTAPRMSKHTQQAGCPDPTHA